ncbi:MAG: glycosyl hydrolase 108 family protein [Bacteroidales bacterium]|nr:glycosyl hydrolase 108 family protein [Bacteroidales bacterium]
MADYKILKPFILSFEGGYTDDPYDLGGATYKGVTLSTYKSYCAQRGLPTPTKEDLRALTDTEWDDIFKGMYWDVWQADDIADQSVANILVDWVWASGAYGIKIPQRVLEVAADGIVGAKTMAALNAQEPRTLFARLKQERLDFIDRICKSRTANKRYKNGWVRRIESIKYGSLLLNGQQP